MRPIDAEVLLNQLEDWRGDKEDLDMEDGHDVAYYSAMSRAMRFVKFSPTLDVAPVMHAKWIPYDEARPGLYFSHRCSNCGGSVEHAYLMRPSSFSDFCPNCGAKMDEEVSCDPD